MKVLVFIDHDVICRHFIMSGALKELVRQADVRFVFPDDGGKRVKLDVHELPLGAPDFSLEKQRYAAAIFSQKSYLRGFNAGKEVLFSSLLPSIWRRRDSRAMQVGLVGWALAVLVLPRKVGMPVARYVCNPANR